jgi:peptidoglycan/LPS O-acetylase OafA/YrhL
MHESYGYNLDGARRYATNRFLRLYPMYWAAAIISIVAISLTGIEYSKTYKSILYIPDSIKDAIYNTIMIFPDIIPFHISPRLSPPTWALTIEICFYICIGLGISKTKKLTIIWTISSMVYFFLSYILDLNGVHRYGTIFAASLPFSLGALIFFYKEQILSLLRKNKISSPIFLLIIYVLSTLFFVINSLYKPFSISYYVGEVGNYLNIFITLLIIVSLYFRGNEIFSKRIDKIIGDYSYPIYLVHWQCGLIASFILFESPTRGLSIKGVESFILTLIFVFIIASVLIALIDMKVSLVRNRVKSKCF